MATPPMRGRTYAVSGEKLPDTMGKSPPQSDGPPNPSDERIQSLMSRMEKAEKKSRLRRSGAVDGEEDMLRYLREHPGVSSKEYMQQLEQSLQKGTDGQKKDHTEGKKEDGEVK